MEIHPTLGTWVATLLSLPSEVSLSCASLVSYCVTLSTPSGCVDLLSKPNLLPSSPDSTLQGQRSSHQTEHEPLFCSRVWAFAE
ncbi:hypothetical protein HD806DRAFT_504576 [Xylariaceae sp. AK1471]|nr:hypothetical protein HD806DRAFT_504576 [Xylariaceae sp. AK1471]